MTSESLDGRVPTAMAQLPWQYLSGQGIAIAWLPHCSCPHLPHRRQRRADPGEEEVMGSSEESKGHMPFSQAAKGL